jgi:hypothetical protein
VVRIIQYNAVPDNGSESSKASGIIRDMFIKVFLGFVYHIFLNLLDLQHLVFIWPTQL